MEGIITVTESRAPKLSSQRDCALSLSSRFRVKTGFALSPVFALSQFLAGVDNVALLPGSRFLEPQANGGEPDAERFFVGGFLVELAGHRRRGAVAAHSEIDPDPNLVGR